MDSDSDWDNCSDFSIPPSLSSYDDCNFSTYSYPSLASSISSHSSLEYWTWPSDVELDYCPCCGPPYPRDMLLAKHFEMDDAYTSWHFAPYRDLRSAARSQRPRKRQKGWFCRSYKCRKERQACAHGVNKKSRREIKKDAVRESQRESFHWTNDGRVAAYRHMEWDIHHPKELDDDIQRMNDIERYTVFNQHAEIFESPEPYVEVGESFSTWCQRRIAEMRAVKESRLLANPHSPPTLHRKPMKWHKKETSTYLRRYDIYCGSSTTTTLPTNAYDALGHELLRNILTPNRFWARKRMIPQASLFQPTNGFRWFGEYEWCWFRTEIGVWEIARWGKYYESRHVEAEECPYCCSGQEKEGMVGVGGDCVCRGSGKRAGPEEVQRCWLVEWVGGDGRKIVRREEQDRRARIVVVGKGGEEQDDVWEICSTVSSDSLSVVDVA